MPINRIRIAIPMVYAALVVLCALVREEALVPVASVGAILVGLAYVVLRPDPSTGRQRNRNSNRG